MVRHVQLLGKTVLRLFMIHCLASGFAGDNIIKVLPSGELNAREMAVAARESSRLLQAMPAEERSKILLSIADALEANEKLITHENEADVADALDDGYESSLLARLALKPGKVSTLAKAIRVLASMEEPIGQVLKRTELSDGFILEKMSSPLGVLLVIFESRPEALVQIASLAIRTGNDKKPFSTKELDDIVSS